MLGPDDDMQDWYRDRAGRTPAPGTRDAILLDRAAQAGAHPFDDTARLVVEWDGTAWQPVSVATNYAEAYGLIAQAGPDPLFPQPDTPVALLRKGSGRHRKQ
ncbi:DUF6087 family protein [Kitasatospora sp. LaBMicrA B282]|uniref:DUF6087 family protein n=1 Tax=Kitasatospora sp. LaBMicrA B282 TaxID=3420949 RepID=UPI003D0AFD27